MKFIFNILIVSILLLTNAACTAQTNEQSGPQTISFGVSGNCEMCQETIEDAVKVKGIKSGRWNMETKVMTVTYLPSKINEEEIHKLIAESGYDTEKVKADDKVYAALPECCRYTRNQAKK